ncbi:MAG TPA: hypothetical protein VD963_01245 [Phycisphaerales bacterium]|nr:hypothetical protein [Phycisphaerales bacterium]
MRVDRGILRAALVRVILIASLVVPLGLQGCEERPAYSQRSPDDVVRSAVSMVRDGQASQLSRLVLADSAPMRAVLDRLGVFLGNLQVLARALQERFPSEVAALRERARQAGASEQGGLLASVFAGRGRGTGMNTDRREQLEETLTRVFADPYGWIEAGADRLSTARLTDDTAAVTLDDRPVLPPMGLMLRQQGDAWYVAVPSHLPPLSNFWPATKDEWSIIGSLIAVLDRAVVELTADVRAGRVSGLDQVASELGDKAVLPGMLAFGAYAREMDVRQRRGRRLEEFRTRQRKWIEVRRERGGGAGAVPEGLVKAIESVRGPELEKIARKGGRPGFAQMSDAQFEDTLEQWLAAAGLRLELSGDLAGPEVSSELERWAATKPEPKK